MRQGLTGEEESSRSATRPVVYCIVPAGVARLLHDPLRRHFAERPDVEVVVERREAERRRRSDRRGGQPRTNGAVSVEQRLVRARDGRRVGERRAALVEVDALELPRKARRHASTLTFVERLEPSSERLEDLDTARVVAAFQAGDQDAFATLYMRYFERVYRYMRVVLHDQHAAEDMTQQVFTKVLEALPRYERRGQPFRAWLFTIARNASVDHLRKQLGSEPVDPAELGRHRDLDDDLAADDLPVLGWISDRELLMLIERMPAVQRQVLVLHYLLDLPHGEIATILDRSPESVRTLHKRSVAFLRARLAALGRGPSRRRPRSRRPLRQAVVLRSRRFAIARSARV